MASSLSSSSSSSLIQGGSLPSFSAIRSRHSSSAHSFLCLTKLPDNGRRSSGYRRMACTAMVQQQAIHGASAIYAKEMERLSAKESLLLAFKDSGGFEALVTGKTTDMQRIDVNERINGLERLNPTPRPTTWNFEWFGAGIPGLFAARFIFERFPKNFAYLSKMDMVIKDGNAKVTANMKLLYSIESKFILLSKLTVEGPLRMKEEYVEGILETPTIIEETVPEQLKGAFGQAVQTVQQLPVPIRDSFSSGLKIPLTSTFQRLFMISYLDDEILIVRDAAGAPEVLTRLDAPASPMAEPTAEYES
ncbi:PREDICTED: probable plastid-lipid-associated protein 13, chloroplastic isoform X2 [Populus euphratica]|uniref:Probable plastid-lipid-associated protein 13, chloroplastic isoform X2 n=1 Tax=Populus euphratica TaxID=75702 RepID=A0AAJ6T585_POPEU|nr:PREDICTED: probable plastid-lipid-associated protein 13, chloroplastic isoform X2 [Populus euphratica]